MKDKHKAILFLIQEYLEKNGEHLRFWQALYNLGVIEGKIEDDDRLHIVDDYNISDEELLERVKSCE